MRKGRKSVQQRKKVACIQNLGEFPHESFDTKKGESVPVSPVCMAVYNLKHRYSSLERCADDLFG